MKYVVILGDGWADYPSKELGGRTPLEVADKPNIDDLCKRGKLGLVKTVPDGMKPGSDVANLSMMGYAPDKYYTGRSPLEALSIGIDLKDSDVAIRCNLVTLSDEENYADKTMLDYSAGEISTEEARQLIEYLQQNLGDEYIDFYT
ncbi:MAG: phosphoglycerate mutase, partial [Clostridia bacterium]|nr:phosphoglycerate mutase [Clostridia bacterium]